MVARLRAHGHHDEATALKHTRWALLKNPPNLTGNQRTTLAGIAKANGGLYRAYLLKEQLRAIFQAVELPDARALLGGWIAWAQRCRLDPFVKLAKTIKNYRGLILNAVEHGLSNACPSHCTSWRGFDGGAGDGLSVAGGSDIFRAAAASGGRFLVGVVEARATAVDAAPRDQPPAAPVADHLRGDAELLGDLVRGEHAARAQS